MTTELLDLTRGAGESDAIRRAADALASGLLIAFPTETVYGIAAVATPAAIARLDALKQRDPTKPFSIHVGDVERAQRYVAQLSSMAQRIMRKSWPGPLTLVVAAPDGSAAPVLDELEGVARDAIWQEQTIGLRCPDHPVARELLNAVDAPVVATSANLAGQSPAVDADEAHARLDGHVDLILDGGRSQYGRASTVVRINGDRYEILREGVVDARTVRRLAAINILFVCTGNTCRSPLAQGLAMRWLADRLGCGIDDLADRGYFVASAGAFAGDGAPAAQHTIDILKARGVNLSAHQSQPLLRELILRADAIYGMTDDHVDAVLQVVPGAAGKTHRLDPGADIPDPIGADRTVYDAAAATIERAVGDRLKELLP